MRILRFGVFEIDLLTGQLRKNGLRLRIQEQPFQILALLAERQGGAVTREEIRQKLWPTSTFGDFNHGLNNAVNRLREVLGDSAESPRFVETLPRRGYRLIVPVVWDQASQIKPHPSEPAEVAVAEATTPSPPSVPAQIMQPFSPAFPGKGARLAAATITTLFLVLIVAAVYWVRVSGRKVKAPIQSLAVLPLENVSGDPNQDYFADGMTDALITNLAELKSIRVISRTSAMHYKGSQKSLPEIAQELKIDAVVEGTVSKLGTHVRINAQLVDAARDQHLWAQQYDSDLQDVLQLQSELASAIAREVAGKLTPREESNLTAKSRQVNPQSYEAYLKGEYFLQKWTADGFAKAKPYFERSITLDPSYAQGYAGLAKYYATVAYMDVVPPREAWLKAEDLLEKALAIDTTSSNAHALFGIAKLHFGCDQAAAEKELNYALELKPGDMTTLEWHSWYLLEVGRMDEAIAEKRRVLEHDPLSVGTSAELGLYLFFAGRIDDAIVQLQSALELDPNYSAAHARLGMAYSARQQYGQAVIEFQKAIELDDRPLRVAKLGEAYARWGKRREALEMISELRRTSKLRYVPPNLTALIYARLGEKRAAITWLEKAKPDDAPRISDHGFDNLRSDPRFKKLEARLKPDPSCPAF
jgi:TolB-like protein/DNA-binding winged helix-turn-helix (wHTH) protein